MAPAVLRAVTLALRAVANVCPASPTCPQDDKCSYVSNGESFQINCATDFLGGDMGSTSAATLTDCIDDCANTNGCVAISYVSGPCYLKSTLEAGQPNDNVIGAYFNSTASASSAPATSSVPASSSAPVLASSSVAVVAPSSAPVVASSSVPIAASSSVSVAASSSVAASVPASAATACPASYTCPDNNGCTIAGADSRTFVLACGMDVPGGDYTSMTEPSLDACNQACAQNTTCVAAAYTGGSGAGACYFKNQNNGPSSNPNVNAIYLNTNAAPVSSSVPTAAQSTPMATSSTPAVSSSVPAASSTPIPSSAAAAPATSSMASSPVVASASSKLVSSATSAQASSSALSSSALSSSKVVLSTSSLASSTLATVTTSPLASSSAARSSTIVVSSTPKSSATPTLSAVASSIISSSALPVSSSKTTTSSTVKSTPTPAATQVVNNPSFELGSSTSATSWSFTGSSLSTSNSGRVQGNAHTGAYSFQAQGQFLIIPWTLNLAQTISVVPGKAYTVQFFAKQLIPGNCVLQASFNNVPLALGTSVPLIGYTASIAPISSLLTTASGSSASLSITAFCATGGSTSSLWLDDVTVTVV